MSGAADAPLAASAARRDPDAARARILSAAIEEFAANGLSGARVDAIATRARVNKRMLYHYVGNKEALYLAALEHLYGSLREAERALELDHLDPEDGLRRLIAMTWRHFVERPELIRMLNTENLHQARHLARSTVIRDLHSPLTRMLADLLRRGEQAGVFRGGVDPVQLYVSIAGLGYFYLSNQHTLSTIFGRDLGAPAALAARIAHIQEVVLGFLRPDGERAEAIPPRAA